MVDVAVDVAPEQLGDALRIVAALGLGEPQVEDGSIITRTTPQDPSIITRALASEGIYLSGLATRRATLEEAFLELTHRAETTEAVEA